MNAEQIERHFSRIGARVKIHPPDRYRRTPVVGVAIDIQRDAHGEFFDVAIDQGRIEGTQVLDIQPSMRHLLLMANQADAKHKFLCGHDERHWFVAAVPEKQAASTVMTAFQALKPRIVKARESRLGLSTSQRITRRNEAFIRQGEWFFVPVEDQASVDLRWRMRRERISRGRGKPHICEELVRQGGETVYVTHGYGMGLTESQYKLELASNPAARRLHWVVQRRNPQVYVRGRVRHPDHKTIILDGWHQVLMNTENESSAMRHVAFID